MKITKYVVMSVMFLSGCSDLSLGNTPKSSKLPRLEIGMTRQEVAEIIGPPIFGSGSFGCDTHIYNEYNDAYFIYACFKDGRLQEATDQHKNIFYIE